MLALVTGTSYAAAPTAYEQWKAQHQQQYHAFKKQYLQRYKDFSKRVNEQWHDYAELSNQQQYVIYNKALSVKTVLDFKKNEIRVEARDGAPLPNKEDVLAQLRQQTVQQAMADDPIMALHDDAPQNSQSLLAALTGEPAQTPDSTTPANAPAANDEPVADTATSEHHELTDNHGQTIKQLRIQLPASPAYSRAQPYLPTVNRYAQQYDLDPALLLGVMKVESSFNPLAQSPIPAFGLMQIVPTSAGLDVNQHLFERLQPPSEQELFDAKTNIGYGSGYLHLLNDRYLSGITDPTSRMYCIIAAYNTGSGNVARVFNKDDSRSVRKALPHINALSPDQVYRQLELNLPYQETRDYLQRVTAAHDDFSNL